MQHVQNCSTSFSHGAEELVAQHVQRFLYFTGPVSENLWPLNSTSDQTTIIAGEKKLNHAKSTSPQRFSNLSGDLEGGASLRFKPERAHGLYK